MNKKILLYLVATVTWFMFTASTCLWGIPYEEVVNVFVFQNNTNDTLVWKRRFYPDTLLDNTTINFKWVNMIPPNGRDSVTYTYLNRGKNNLRVYFSRIPYGYFRVIFISLDTIKKYGWEDVVKNNRVYQRYDLCYDDVAPIKAATVSYTDNPDWELWLSVPPTDCMKDVKMWPPYGHYEIIGQ